LLSGDLTRRPPTLDTAIYDLIPEGHPLTDPGKARITVGQVLSMTGGFTGEQDGALGVPTGLTAGPFEHALGRAPNRFGISAEKLAAEPGTRWDYSDIGYSHLAPAFAHATGREIADVMRERVFSRIGIEHAAWDIEGGSGYLGPHTNPHTGLRLSARELARFGYLALRGGQWNGEQVIPAEWQAMATRPSQELNPSYGYGWWTNANDSYAPGAPRDLFALAGFAGNRCYMVPSLDLVIARVGTGPFVLDERSLTLPIIDAVLK
jgi:CubicO group peptidase (beta-lactamase class C family)